MKKKILITGGCGFIGLNFVNYILKNKKKISLRILDNFSNKNKKRVSKILDAIGFKETEGCQIIEGDIPDGWEGVDIGPMSIEIFNNEVKNAKTVLWNGPMGIFEIEACNKGTFAVAKTIAESDACSIIGGGDSVAAVEKAGLASKMSHISTGGGASLELLEGKILPGVDSLRDS